MNARDAAWLRIACFVVSVVSRLNEHPINADRESVGADNGGGDSGEVVGEEGLGRGAAEPPSRALVHKRDTNANPIYTMGGRVSQRQNG